MTLVIAGTEGADPSSLAVALKRCGWAGRVVVAGTVAEIAAHAPAARVAVLALDSSMPAADEETELLGALAAARVPTALVACRVDAFPSWPRTLAASRARLDADRRLPVFATAAVLADAPTGTPGSTQSGVAELAQWCVEEHDDSENLPTVHSAPASAPARDAAPGSSTALRADRLAGLRAGIVAARTEAASSTRAALGELTGRIPEVCATPGFEAWLPRVLDGVEQRSRTMFAHRLGQVRAAATCGLGGTPATEPAVESTRAAGPLPVPRRKTRTEDAVVVVVGASMGFGVGRMILAPALEWAGLGVAGTILSLAAGLLVALWMVSARRDAADRVRWERWAAEQIAARRTAVDQWIGSQAGAAEAHVSREIWNRTRPVRVGGSDG